MSEQKLLPLFSSVIGNNERTTIADRVYDYCYPILTDDKDGMILLNNVKVNNVVLQDAFAGLTRTSPYTPKLRNVVSERTLMITFIHKIIKAQKFNALDTRAMAAAKTLELELQHALRTHRISTYAGGSRAVKEILLQCKKKKNRELIKYLGLEKAIDRLTELQTQFSKTYTTKVATEHHKKDITITKASKKLFESLEHFCDHIAINAHLHKGIYISMVKTINEIIEDVNTLARMGKTKRSETDNHNAEERDVTDNGTEQAA